MNKKFTCLCSIILAFTSLLDVALSFSPATRGPSAHSRLFESADEPIDDGDDALDMDAFKARKQKQQQEAVPQEVEEEFDGYAFRDVIDEKWGLCYDVEFNSVDTFGFRGLYLNVLPFHVGGRRFRHETELDYLCHLQAVVEILLKYDQVTFRKRAPLAGDFTIRLRSYLTLS
jgi:hypothetical protein